MHTAKLVCCRSVMWLLSNPLNSWCSKAKSTTIGRPRKSKSSALCASYFTGSAMLLHPLWNIGCRGCVFETLLAKPSKLEATDQQSYVTIRSQWPCDPAVCQLLFGVKITTLVSALLSCPSTPKQHLSLFNDQVLSLAALLYQHLMQSYPCHARRVSAQRTEMHN